MRKMNKSLVLLVLSLLGSCESMTYGVENSKNIQKSVSYEVSDKLNDLSLKANLSDKKGSKVNSKKNSSELNKINSSNKKISKTKLALGIGIPTAAGMTLLGIGAWKFGPGIIARLRATSNQNFETKPLATNLIPKPEIGQNKPIQKKEKYNYKTVFEDFMETKDQIDNDPNDIFKTVVVKQSPKGLILDMGAEKDVTMNSIDYSISFSDDQNNYNADFKKFCSWLKMEFTLGVGSFELDQLLQELSKFETKKTKPYDYLDYNLRQWVFLSKGWNCMLCKVKNDDNFYGAFAHENILLPFIIEKK